VIGRTLEAVFAQDYVGSMQVIVVANGCEDETVAVASSFATAADARRRELHVVDLDKAGKPAALNAGDALASGEIRVYLDADVTLSPNAVSSLVRALDVDGTEFAAPDMVIARSRSRVVRDYLKVWSRMPYVLDGGAGRGVYAVSAAGRSRWSTYPELTADDTFARLQFSASEVAIVHDATVTIRFPETLHEMVAVRGRLFLGIWELHRKNPGLAASAETSRGRTALRTIARSPDLWLRAPSFFGIYILGWLHARRSIRRNDATWARAASSRVST
jgi:cellulose synthase/poly-beta-1,6-N-acetylglucosamine synthase-like glycosyltransferase